MQDFQMPWVTPGLPVLYYIGSDSKDGAIAIVTRIGSRTINLCILPDLYRMPVPRSGVRHKDDPDRKRDDGEDGFWDHTEYGLLLRRLQDEFFPRGVIPAAVAATVQALEKLEKKKSA